MALFVDRELPVEANSIQVDLAWHQKYPLLAVGAYSEERGGYVRVIDTSLGGGLGLEEGLPIPPHATAQVSALSWHPIQKQLIVGWENGEVYMYDHEKGKCLRIEADASHQAAVALIKWSTFGRRLITTDKTGSVIGWKLDAQKQLSVIFHHELKDELRGLVFCSGPSLVEAGDYDLSGLARAAVAGDETALDMFSSYTNPNSQMDPNSMVENLNCYAGSASGIIYFLNDNGSCMEVLQADGAVKYLLHYAYNDLIIVITESMVIGQFQMDEDGSISEVSRIKISTRSKENPTVWVGSGLLAIAIEGLNIRIWDLKTDDNFVLPTLPGSSGSASELISSLDFCSDNNVLAAATNAGYVYMWKYPSGKRPGEDDWQVLPRVHIGPTIRALTWGGGHKFMAINCVRQVFVLSEQELAVDYQAGVSAMQTTPTNILVTFHGTKDTTTEISAPAQVSTLSVTPEHVFLYGGKIMTFELQKDISHVMAAGEFALDSIDLVTADDSSIYTLEGDRINVRSFQGTIKHSLALNDDSGGLKIQVKNQYLMVCSQAGVVKIWDVSKRDMRAHCHPINIREKIGDYHELEDVQMNCNGTFISVTVRQNDLVDPKLYIYEIEKDLLRYFNFAAGQNDFDDVSVPPNSAQSHLRSLNDSVQATTFKSSSASVVDKYVVNHSWDLNEVNFLACFTKESQSGKPALISLFVHEDLGVVVHGSQTASDGLHKLISVEIPFLVTLESDFEDGNKGPGVKVKRIVMSDFVGLEASDKATRDAVIKFSFYLSIGNMEEAFKSIKTIKNQNVWGNLARMCVKSQRLDVAAICLGKMEHAAGARALRQINAQHVDKDVKTAVLAVYLGMPEEAEQLFIRCKRYDLLNKLYQDSGQWEKALEVAENHDRIHLRSTFYNFAKHLEKKGDISSAIQNYEKSGTHRFEVPRLLFEDWNILEAYIQKTNDKELKRWWAQYMESTGEMELALQYYELAEDYLSLVRVYSYCDNLEKAAEIANSSGDKAACYHLARQYENIDNIPEAIHFFSKAQAYSNAIRICKEQGYYEQLWNMAVLAGPNEKLDAAKFFEHADKPQFDKAVILYEKAGYVGKALELAFETKQHNVLQYISTNFNENTDPLLLDKTAGFFLQHEQYDKAVDLYVASVQGIKALELCLQYNININEEMAEKLSSGDKFEKSDKDDQLRVLNKIAEVAYQQGNYHMATKKWTQAGNRLQAMKSLLKSGDTEKIIFFANVSRQREIYILAGNYLQTLDWRNNAEIMKNIIKFYNKARASDLLAMFYHACAEVEIDEYQNYEKAHGALSECMKNLVKTEPQSEAIHSRMSQVNRSMDLIAKFVDCQKMYDTNAARAIEGCRALLKEPNINLAVRKGDIYGFMIEHFVKQQNHKQAYALILELRNEIPNVNLAYYVNTDILLSIEKSLGVILQVDTQPKFEQEVEDD